MNLCKISRRWRCCHNPLLIKTQSTKRNWMATADDLRTAAMWKYIHKKQNSTDADGKAKLNGRQMVKSTYSKYCSAMNTIGRLHCPAMQQLTTKVDWWRPHRIRVALPLLPRHRDPNSPSGTIFLGSTGVSTPNRTWICLVIFAQRSCMTRPTYTSIYHGNSCKLMFP